MQRTTVEGKRTSKCSLHWTRSPSCLHCFFVFVADNRLLTTADAVASAPHATGTSKSANIIFPIVAVSRLYLQYATVVVRPHPVFPDSPRNWGCTGVMHLHTSPAGWQRGQSKWCLPTTACTFSTCRCLMAFVVHPIMYTNDGPYRQSSKEGAAGGQAKQLLAKEKGGGGLRGMLSSARSLAWGRRKGGAGVRGEEEDNRVSEQDCLFGQLGELSQVRPGTGGKRGWTQEDDGWHHLPGCMGAESWYNYSRQENIVASVSMCDGHTCILTGNTWGTSGIDPDTVLAHSTRVYSPTEGGGKRKYEGGWLLKASRQQWGKVCARWTGHFRCLAREEGDKSTHDEWAIRTIPPESSSIRKSALDESRRVEELPYTAIACGCPSSQPQLRTVPCTATRVRSLHTEPEQPS